MEILLIIAGLIVWVAVVGFVWALCKVASDADDQMEGLYEARYIEKVRKDLEKRRKS
jgi:hypothetical protein